MSASKLINDDVTKQERKNRREMHKEQFRRAREAEAALAANWSDQGARRDLNSANPRRTTPTQT